MWALGVSEFDGSGRAPAGCRELSDKARGGGHRHRADAANAVHVELGHERPVDLEAKHVAYET